MALTIDDIAVGDTVYSIEGGKARSILVSDVYRDEDWFGKGPYVKSGGCMVHLPAHLWTLEDVTTELQRRADILLRNAAPRNNVIYVFGIKHRHSADGFAIDADGALVTKHHCSEMGYVRGDMGYYGTWKHDEYWARYPNGFRLIWVDRPKDHPVCSRFLRGVATR